MCKVEVKNIQKRYGKKAILEDISFKADSGECVAIVGRNGCGKTTLLQILAGVLRPDEGEISYYNHNPLKQSGMFRRYIGYVPQEMPLLEELSVRDNLRMWGATHSKAYSRIVSSFDLADIMKVPVNRLSGGMKRRLCIACALAQWPPVLLLDEPTTALDLYYKESIQSWIHEFKSMNGILIMATHDEKEILTSDRCLVMCRGRLREVSEEHKNMTVIKRMMNGNL